MSHRSLPHAAPMFGPKFGPKFGLMFAQILALTLATAPMARANDFQPITDKTTFLQLVKGRSLDLGMFNVTLTLSPDGTIKGRALGWDITGAWHWQDGYFCRQMDWSGKDIPYNCQLVEAANDSILRFTVDKGAGDAAQFTLR